MQKKIVRRSPQIPHGEKVPLAGVHPLLQHVLLNRGVNSVNGVDYRLERLAPLNTLKGLPEAVSLLADAIERQQRILIVGDFDTDGATSSALCVLALRAMGAKQVDYLVPNRFEFGYGLTPAIVDVARDYQPDLLVTVDNGIASIEGVKAARKLGMKVVVTDHHLPGNELPEADAIVNPNQPGCAFPSKNLAGVGVAFYVMCGLRAHLRERDWFASQNLPEPVMADYLDLVALGTVADVVPLDFNNRVLVEQGMRRIRAGRCRPGITALLLAGKRNPQRLVASDLGFAVGPRLNAAGRLDDMSHGIECLLAEIEALAWQYATELNDLNADRRSIEQGMQQEALKMLDTLALEPDELPWGLALYDPGWHQGVIGILASRIKDRFHRPVIAFARANDSGSELKGSARSIKGLHIRDALDAIATRHPGLLSKFGGHAMAAGLSLDEDKLPAFREAFDRQVRMVLSPHQLDAVIDSDGTLEPEWLTLEAAEALRSGGPWGQGFPEPVFDGQFQLVEQRLVGEKHLKLLLQVPDTEVRVEGIAFHVDTTRWPDASVSRVTLAYRLDVNEFRGEKTPQLMVEWLAPVEHPH